MVSRFKLVWRVSEERTIFQNFGSLETHKQTGPIYLHSHFHSNHQLISHCLLCGSWLQPTRSNQKRWNIKKIFLTSSDGVSLLQKWLQTNMQGKGHLDSKKCNGTWTVESIVKQGDHFMSLKCSTAIKHQNNIRTHKKHCKNIPLKRKNMFLMHMEKHLIFSLDLMKINGNILTLLAGNFKNPSRENIFSVYMLQNVHISQWLSHSMTNRFQKQPILYCTLTVM